MSLEDQLIEAAQKGDLKGVQAALADGIDVNAKCRIALAEAAYSGHLEVVQALIKTGADVHVNNDVALRWASLNNNLRETRSRSSDRAIGSSRR